MPEFIAVVFRSPLAPFVAEFPGLTGCMAFSNTLEEIPEAAADALGGFLEEMERCGEPIPEPPTFEEIASDLQFEGSVASFAVGRRMRCDWAAAGVVAAERPIAANDNLARRAHG